MSRTYFCIKKIFTFTTISWILSLTNIQGNKIADKLVEAALHYSATGIILHQSTFKIKTNVKGNNFLESRFKDTLWVSGGFP